MSIHKLARAIYRNKVSNLTKVASVPNIKVTSELLDGETVYGLGKLLNKLKAAEGLPSASKYLGSSSDEYSSGLARTLQGDFEPLKQLGSSLNAALVGLGEAGGMAKTRLGSPIEGNFSRLYRYLEPLADTMLEAAPHARAGLLAAAGTGTALIGSSKAYEVLAEKYGPSVARSILAAGAAGVSAGVGGYHYLS